MSCYPYVDDCLKVTMQDTKTMEIKTFLDGGSVEFYCSVCPWGDMCYDTTHPKTDVWACRYHWALGNASCDCNRYFYFYPERGGEDEDYICGNTRFLVLNITDLDGKVLYRGDVEEGFR